MKKSVVDRPPSGPLRVGRSEIRPFHDFAQANGESNGNGDKIGFVPGGSYERGKYPALDRALDQLEKMDKPTVPEK